MKITSANNFNINSNYNPSKKAGCNQAQLQKAEDRKTGYYLPLNFTGQTEKPNIVDILNFIDTSEPISEAGLKGIVYKMETKGGTYAIKVGRSQDDDFVKEAKVLKKVPKELTGQRFVDYFAHPKTGKDILISTFADGKQGILSTKEDFEKLFKSLNILDNAGVLHGDLNMGNLLIDGDNINIIDYGEGSTFTSGDTYEEMYPDFIVKTNIINLEQNGIPDCIKKWDENGINTKEAFKNYIEAKAQFYEKHKEITKNSGNKKAYDYEENLAKVLKNPDEDILRNEAMRMDVLYTFEAADTAVNYKKYPDSSIRNWMMTINKAQSMEDLTACILADNNISDDKRKYFEYQNEIAKTLVSTYKNWGEGTINWIKSIDKKPENELSEHEKTLKANKGKQMELPPSLAVMVLEAQ